MSSDLNFACTLKRKENELILKNIVPCLVEKLYIVAMGFSGFGMRKESYTRKKKIFRGKTKSFLEIERQKISSKKGELKFEEPEKLSLREERIQKLKKARLKTRVISIVVSIILLIALIIYVKTLLRYLD